MLAKERSCQWLATAVADSRGELNYSLLAPHRGFAKRSSPGHPAGMRWTLEGTQAMLHSRALYLNGDWNKFVAYRIQKEQAALDPYKACLPA